MTCALLCLLLVPAAADSDTFVACPAEFRAALAPWVEFREAQGHGVLFATNPADAAAIRREIRQVAARRPLRYVLLVGDALRPSGSTAAERARAVPTHHAEAQINVRFGSEPHIASDAWYADLDDDRVPDLAIGRLTADTPAELTRMVAKVLAYEQSHDFGPWRRHIQFVAGLGGFGPVADAALEMAAKNVITLGVPAPFTTSLTHASPLSPYYPDPRRFNEAALSGLTDGCWFWVYLGHGQRRSLDRVPTAAGWQSILEAQDAAWLRAQRGMAVAFLLACYTGAFDGPEDCLAEEMLRSDGGPVAVVCGSRVTMPYAMAVLGTELLDQCFVVRQPTLGGALLAAKQASLSKGPTSERRQALDSLATLLNPGPADLTGERAEHVELFNLLGDPLLSLKHPQAVTLAAPQEAKAGETLEVTGTATLSGTATVELVVRRDRLRFEPPPRITVGNTMPAASQADECRQTYQSANDPCWSQVQVRVAADKPFHARLPVPAEAHGAGHVRVYVEGEQGCAVGAADVEIGR